MAKIRNSLGVLVLPTTGGSSISFEEYEKRNGINLHSLLVLDSDNQYLGLNPDISKIVCLDTTQASIEFGYDIGRQVARLQVVNEIATDTMGDQEYSDYDLNLTGHTFMLRFRHIVYSDGTTPDEFVVFTQEA